MKAPVSRPAHHVLAQGLELNGAELIDKLQGALQMLLNGRQHPTPCARLRRGL